MANAFGILGKIGLASVLAFVGCARERTEPYRIRVSPGDSLEAVRDRVRAVPASNRVHGVEVILAPGTYALEQMLLLEARDSGTTNAPVVWRAADPTDRPRLVGGVEIPRARFRTVDDPALLGRLDPPARGRVLVADISSCGFVQPYGPDSPLELRATLNLPDVFVNGRRIPSASYPAEGWCEIAEIVDKGSAYGEHSVEQARKLGILKPDEVLRGGTFRYREDRPAAWRDPVMIECFWAFDWRSTVIWTKEIDVKGKTMTMRCPHQYGIKMGNPRPRRWRAINVFEELSRPATYVVDAAKGLLYLNPPDGPFASVGICCRKDPLVRLKGAHDIVFSGIDFGRSWTSGVEMESARRITIERAEFREQRTWAVRGTDVRDVTIRTCRMTETGDGGFFLSGGDRRTLTPGNNLIIDCLLENWGSLRSHCGYGIRFEGCGNNALHNVIRNANGYVVTYKQNDGLFAYNVVSNTTWGVDDASAFYKGLDPSMRGNRIEYNYWRDIGAPGGHGSAAIYFDDGDSGDTVFGNVFENCGRTGRASGSFGAVFSHGGCSNICRNCIFIRCDRALGSGPWSQEKWEKPIKGLLPIRYQNYDFKFASVDYRSPVWKARYPELETFLDPYPDEIRWNAAYDNAFVDCPATLTYNGGKEKVPGYVKGRWFTNETDVVISGDPGFVDASRRDYRLRDDSQIYRKIPNFRPIPFGWIGLLTPEGERPTGKGRE